MPAFVVVQGRHLFYTVPVVLFNRGAYVILLLSLCRHNRWQGLFY